MFVKIIKVSKDLYWYKDLIGECIEVRPRMGYRMVDDEHTGIFGEQYYVMIEENQKRERYINFDDCVECTRYMKIMKIKDKL